MLNKFLSNPIYVMASAIFIVALTAVVAIQKVSIADEPYSLYPCNGKSGRITPCGGSGPPEPGNCAIFVGAPSTCTDDCTEAHGYMCRTDDACLNASKDVDSFCETANYAGTTYKWYYDCPTQPVNGGCSCSFSTDLTDTIALNWKAITWDSDNCP